MGDVRSSGDIKNGMRCYGLRKSSNKVWWKDFLQKRNKHCPGREKQNWLTVETMRTWFVFRIYDNVRDYAMWKHCRIMLTALTRSRIHDPYMLVTTYIRSRPRWVGCSSSLGCRGLPLKLDKLSFPWIIALSKINLRFFRQKMPQACAAMNIRCLQWIVWKMALCGQYLWTVA